MPTDKKGVRQRSRKGAKQDRDGEDKAEAKMSTEEAFKQTSIVSLQDIRINVSYCEPSGFGPYVVSLEEELRPYFPNLTMKGTAVKGRYFFTALLVGLRILSFSCLLSFVFQKEFTSLPVLGLFFSDMGMTVGAAVVCTVLSYGVDRMRRTKAFEIEDMDTGKLLYSRKKEGGFP
eukprot:CAMPEP_0113888134 /NCGR_PEP_ID=MMETSP0780_2-20120614/12666_1 /TAXON_ID=652834 /ORGANISM="Palpitomonas bilix" /LENGTH=174 /DNA_ID=CAMNT_0000876875 /DNA_START=115 /DNA_END=635 /DNA_ORIENTATION=+ /assembly_acc=CAM_ASM_000599